MRRKNLFAIIIILAIIAWVTHQVFFSNEIGDLAGGFTEVSSYRNENNTGPVQYVFTVTVKDTIWSEMETYGNYKPHHKGGTTKVYYFKQGTPVPTELFPGNTNFDESYNHSCIAMYEKSAVGNVIVTKQPYN